MILRLPTGEDFDAYADFMADPDSAEFLGGVQPRSTAWRGFAQIVGAWQIRGFSMFSVIEKVSDEWIGRVGPWMPDGWPGTEIAWGTVRSRCNRGYATEAAAAMLAFGFDELGLNRIHAAHLSRNPASGKVMKKAGMVLEGTARQDAIKWGRYEDLVSYGILREDWIGSRQ